MINLFYIILKKVSGYPRFYKRLIVIFVDIFLCLFSSLSALLLLNSLEINFNLIDYILFVLTIIISIAIFWINGMYFSIFRYSGFPVFKTITISLFLYFTFYFLIFFFINPKNLPISFVFLQPLILFNSILAFRLIIHFLFNNIINKKNYWTNLLKVAIYGTGKEGRNLADSINASSKFQLICYFDEDIRIHNQTLNGVKVYHHDSLKEIIDKYSIDLALLAIPYASREKRNNIISYLIDLKVTVRTIPSVEDLSNVNIGVSDINELDIDDLIGRNKVKPDKKLLSRLVTSKNILVTGAGGSIGSQLCLDIINENPKNLILLDSSEFNLYNIMNRLIDNNKNAKKLKTIPLIGSVTDEAFIKKLFKNWRIDTVYHAAAYKHVHIVEYNSINSINNNIFGTKILAEQSIKNKVSNFVFISTDKAVRPTNLMGATKRFSELIIQALHHRQKENNKTLLTIVRFGNVLKSSGSAIPKFRQQINEKGPVTLTHPEMKRFFMTIKEASQLVLQAGALSRGGEVFVLDMGKPILIKELIHKMIKLSGNTIRDDKNPNGDIEIKIIGLRPGEKLFEEILIGNNPQKTQHTKIIKANEDFLEWNKLNKFILDLEQKTQKYDLKSSFEIINKVIPEFNHSNNYVDIFYLRSKKITK